MEKRLIVKNISGFHLRPDKGLCNRAIEYESSVMIRFRGREFNAKSLLGVLSACVQQKDEIVLVCTGADEEKAISELSAYIESGMGEGTDES